MTETYSPGLEGVIAGETAVSTLEGGLRYRGYDIEDLTQNATYEETAYLILYGEAPTADQAKSFAKRLADAAAATPSYVIETLRKIPASAPFMDVMRTGASLIAHSDPDVENGTHDANVRKAERILGQMPVILAARERLLRGKEPVAPRGDLSFPANLLWMLRGEVPSANHVHAMDVSLILYAEHEFNASTFSARCISSTLSDLHSAIVGAIGALKGPLHGGANERALETVLAVESPETAEGWIRSALARKERIMGFGHRVYKDGDPRATFLKKVCVVLAKETGNESLEKIADTIEAVVRAEKKLPPNVDWPCARLYYYMKLDKRIYTPLFVVARVVGWAAHVIEQLDDNRLMRPRSIYVGKPHRAWVKMSER